jgi:hypothetical protein
MAPAGKVLLVEAVIPEGTAGADATRVDTTRASIETCSIAPD